MPSSPIKLTSQVTFRHSSSKLQLHSRTQKSCALFCHFMALILTPFSFQRIWKLFLNNYFQTDGVVTVSDILTFFRSCTPGQLKLMSQVSKLVMVQNRSPYKTSKLLRMLIETIGPPSADQRFSLACRALDT